MRLIGFHRQPGDVIELAVGHAAKLRTAAGRGQVIIFHPIAVVLHVVMDMAGKDRV